MKKLAKNRFVNSSSVLLHYTCPCYGCTTVCSYRCWCNDVTGMEQFGSLTERQNQFKHNSWHTTNTIGK